jgi:hypothetical protein
MPDLPAILQELPYFNRRTTVLIGGREEIVKPTQIVIWVSITDIGQDEVDPATPHLPVILDTGLTHNFAIKEEHLTRWAGLDPRSLSKRHEITIKGDAVPLHQAEVWLHPNRPGERDRFTDRPPFRLRLEHGIAVYPRGMPAAPRLPLLGLPALEWSNLYLMVDCEHRRVRLRTRRRFWAFGR